jgi:hypothetical protein
MGRINYQKHPKKDLVDKQSDKQNDKRFWQIFISRNVSQGNQTLSF